MPLGLVSGSPYLLAVRASLPTQDFAQFAAYAKANPAKLNFGSAGQASSPHLGLELLKMTAGLDIVHVPFKSGSEAVNAAIGGQVDVVMDASPVIMPHVAAGKLRALAASDRPQRGRATRACRSAHGTRSSRRRARRRRWRRS